MPILDDLKQPLRRIILVSPLHRLLSEDHALVSFTDHMTGRHLSFSVPYQKEHRIIRVIYQRDDKYWRKFMYGSPLSITIQGTQYHGWAEIVDNPEEIRKEWRAIIKNKPELASQLNINVNKGQEADLENILAKVSSLKILRIEISGKR